MFRIVYFKICFGFILISFFLGSCKEKETRELPYYNTPDFTPLFINSESEVEKKVTHRIADFSFLDQNKNLVTQKDIEGKIHVANFFFTSCGSICPVMMNNFAKISDAFSKDTNIVLLSYNVTPWIDTIERLKSYAVAHDYTSAQWHLLTGDKSQLYELARKSYFAEEDIGFTKDSSDFLHTEHFILVDKNKRIRGIYNGTLELEVQQIIEDIKQVKQE